MPPLIRSPVCPRCAYRMHLLYDRSQPMSQPNLYEFILVSYGSFHSYGTFMGNNGTRPC